MRPFRQPGQPVGLVVADPLVHRLPSPDWITARGRYFGFSLAVGVLVALVALPSFTGALPNKIGGFLLLVVVVTAIVRQAIRVGEGFMQGWREPQRPTSR